MLIDKIFIKELFGIIEEKINSKDDDITWITVKGVHIPIKKNEDKKESIHNGYIMQDETIPITAEIDTISAENKKNIELTESDLEKLRKLAD